MVGKKTPWCALFLQCVDNKYFRNYSRTTWFSFRGAECNFPGERMTKRGMKEERGGKIRFYRPVFHPIAILFVLNILIISEL